MRTSFVELQFSPQGVAFLTDAIIMQRYVELEGQLRRVLSVVKVRSSPHSADLREYKITKDGLMVMDPEMGAYRGLLTGAPRKLSGAARTNGRRQDGAVLLVRTTGSTSVGARVAAADSARAAFTRQLRALPAAQRGRVPALALSAYARVEDAARAKKAGYQSHMAKPAEIDALVDTIAALIALGPRR